jgi:type IV pilus assembly protein PilE
MNNSPLSPTATRKSRRIALAAKGFTLIELLIVSLIIAMLAAFALPAYNDYIVRSRIPEATSGLANKRARVELYYDNNRTYVGAPDCDPDSTTSKYFTFSCSSELANAYVLQAVGTGAMTGFTYTINQSNAKATTAVPGGWSSNAGCWVLRKDGSC